MSFSFQISGHEPRHAGSGPTILTALKRKEKLKILMAVIDLLDKEDKRKSCVVHEGMGSCDTLGLTKYLPSRRIT
jgi:hypothetical protein